MPPRKTPKVVAHTGGSAEDPDISTPGWASPDHLLRRIREARQAVAALTPRQRQVLQGILRGDSCKRIAYDLGISPRTVEVHRSSMLDRLGARSTADAVRIGIYAEMDASIEQGQ